MYKILLVKSKVTLVTLLRACQDTALPECAIPHTKTSLRVPHRSFTSTPRGPRHCRRLPFGEPCGHLFALNSPQCVCTVTVVPLCGHFAPKVGPKTPHGAQKVPKRCPQAHFGEPKAPLLGPKLAGVAPCENTSRGYVFITL